MYGIRARWPSLEAVGEGRQKEHGAEGMKTLFRFAEPELKEACRSRPSRYFTASRVEVPSRRSPFSSICVWTEGMGQGPRSIDE